MSWSIADKINELVVTTNTIEQHIGLRDSKDRSTINGRLNYLLSNNVVPSYTLTETVESDFLLGTLDPGIVVTSESLTVSSFSFLDHMEVNNWDRGSSADSIWQYSDAATTMLYPDWYYDNNSTTVIGFKGELGQVGLSGSNTCEVDFGLFKLNFVGTGPDKVLVLDGVDYVEHGGGIDLHGSYTWVFVYRPNKTFTIYRNSALYKEGTFSTLPDSRSFTIKATSDGVTLVQIDLIRINSVIQQASRTSPIYDLNVIKGTLVNTIVTISKEHTASPSSMVILESRTSLDEGNTWSDWEVTQNGGSLSNIVGFSLSNAKLQLKQTLISNDGLSIPSVGEISINFFVKNDFLSLLDTPKSYTGRSGSRLIVNSTEDGITFTDIDESQLITDMIAGETLSALRIVVRNDNNEAIYADNTNLNHVDKIIGMTCKSAVLGEKVKILEFGEFEDLYWTFDTSKVLFLSSLGNITQEVPTVGFVCKLGTVIKPERILLRIQPGIVLV